ncbi:MAG TPA: chemotaxis protein CheW, partial [Kofleriaceae bacterium]|nr:chemotaxis protein CheW [Kofleriaceae bacterium]
GLLLVRQGARGRYAVPLDAIDRLAEVEPSALARTGDDEVVQLDGELLPVLRLGATLGPGSEPDGALLSLVVCRAGAHRVGVAVDQVLDIIDDPVQERWSNLRPGVSGSLLLHGHVVELIDLPGLLGARAPHHLASAR